MYFHMTLSLLGQLLDEIAILWLLASSYSIWMPRCYFPTFLGENRWGWGRSSVGPIRAHLSSLESLPRPAGSGLSPDLI